MLVMDRTIAVCKEGASYSYGIFDTAKQGCSKAGVNGGFKKRGRPLTGGGCERPPPSGEGRFSEQRRAFGLCRGASLNCFD